MYNVYGQVQKYNYFHHPVGPWQIALSLKHVHLLSQVCTRYTGLNLTCGGIHSLSPIAFMVKTWGSTSYWNIPGNQRPLQMITHGTP